MTFQMPAVRVGDMVQWSGDPHHFSSPCIGWIMSTPGAATVNILTFAPNLGFTERLGVHHKDDPQLPDNPGWQENGVWALTPQQQTINRLESVAAQMAVQASKTEIKHGKATSG